MTAINTTLYKITVLLWKGHTVVFENCPVSIPNSYDFDEPVEGLLIKIKDPIFQSDLDEQEMRKFLGGRDLNNFSWFVIRVEDDEIIVSEPVIPAFSRT